MIDIRANLRNNPLKRVLFMGTPDFAVSHLDILLNRGDEVIGVVTQPDKPAGRGHQYSPPPVKSKALTHHIPVYQPLNKSELESLVIYLNPDIIIVVAFGMLISNAIVNGFFCLNVHASLLPKYRGAAPIQYSILEGNSETGVSIMVIDEKMDTGPVILSKSISIDPTDNAGDLFDKLSVIGPEALSEALYLIRNKREKIDIIYQDEAKATYTKKLKKEDGKLDLSISPQEIVLKVRAMNPWPGAYVYVDDLLVKVIKAAVDDHGNIKILEVQPANKRKMTYDEYLRGNKPII